MNQKRRYKLTNLMKCPKLLLLLRHPAEPDSRPTRTRNPPDLLSPKMKGQYHGGQSTFAISLVKIYDNVTACIDDMAYLMTIADKDTMTLKDALNEPE